MEKLKGMKVYLSGAMDRVPDGGVGWRSSISSIMMKMGIGVLNPCDKPMKFVEENENTRQEIWDAKNDKDFVKARKIMKPICYSDLRMVDVADFLIVYLDVDVHYAGTYHELALGIMQKKPTLIMCEQGKSRIPNWWWGVIPHELFFSTWDELLSYLKSVNKGENVDDLGRWRFFDFTKIYGSNEIKFNDG